MAQTAFHQPDEAAMQRLLEERSGTPVGIVLLLAWRAGLTRDEIVSLTWDRVDLDALLLRLPDREVPLEPEAAEALQAWQDRCARFTDSVAVSPRLRKRLVPQSLSVMARAALDAAGMPEVRLQDLRYDYVRRQFETHAWPYVLRVSGISVTTYRNGLYRLDPHAETLPEPRDEVGESFRLWRVLQAERATPAGIALWLSSQMGLQGEELVRLTWDQIDFDAELLRLPDREVPLTQGARRVLEEERERRAPGDDPHVLLTPRSRRPMTSARLTTVVRSALIRGGIEDRTMQDLRRNVARDAEKDALRAYAEEHGSITRSEASALLGLSGGQVYARLVELAEEGALVRVNSRYYPADRAVRPGGQEEAILGFIAESGPAYRRDVVELLHLGKRTTERILKRMVAAGELVLLRGTQQYALPAEKVTIQHSNDEVTV